MAWISMSQRNLRIIRGFVKNSSTTKIFHSKKSNCFQVIFSLTLAFGYFRIMSSEEKYIFVLCTQYFFCNLLIANHDVILQFLSTNRKRSFWLEGLKPTMCIIFFIWNIIMLLTLIQYLQSTSIRIIRKQKHQKMLRSVNWSGRVSCSDGNLSWIPPSARYPAPVTWQARRVRHLLRTYRYKWHL